MENFFWGLHYLCMALFFSFPLIFFCALRRKAFIKQRWLKVVILAAAGYVLINACIYFKVRTGWMCAGPEVAFAVFFGWAYLPVFTLIFYGPLYLLSRLAGRLAKVNCAKIFVAVSLATVICLMCYGHGRFLRGHVGNSNGVSVDSHQ